MARIRQQYPQNYGSSGNINTEFETLIRYLNAAELGDNTVGELLGKIFDADGNAADPSNQTNNRVNLNHTLGPLISNMELSSDYTAVLVDFSENVFADISQGTSSYLIDSSDLSSGIVYNYPSNFQEILIKSTSQTLTSYSSLSFVY